jgi:tetraacyldisaccharide 4'-kinase
MRFYEPILYPFAVLYSLATTWRNHLFDIGSKKSTSFLVPVIVVGNLSVGGTGKTPAVEFLLRHLKSIFSLAVVSRGYKRKSSGFLLASDATHPWELGDEPFQLYQKFGADVTIAVGESRALAIPQVLAERPQTNLIILDDAFQHRYVQGDLYLLLTTYQKPFFTDRILPLGTLREDPKGANRADAVIVTKCPEGIEGEEKKDYAEKINRYTRSGIPVFFASIRYGVPMQISEGDHFLAGSVIVVSGIASNTGLLEEAKRRFEVLEVLEYPDHHHYRQSDLDVISNLFLKHKEKFPILLTTEKDAVKLKVPEFLPFWTEIPIFALPMEMCLAEEDLQRLMEMIFEKVKIKGYQSGA